MESTRVYRLWQAPFAAAKFAPVLANNNLRGVRRVLDVGCGPGINANHFARTQYVGIDHNPGYIKYAREHYKGEFVLADAVTYPVPQGQHFDFILINSFLHHINAPDIDRVLSHMSTLLTEDGHIHIVDLVLPDSASIARWLTLHDRGDFPRSLDQLLEVIEENLKPVVVRPYNLGVCGITLWNMVYMKCRPRR